MRGRRGTWRHRPSLCVASVLWWRAWFPVDAVDAAALCMAGLALIILGWLRYCAWVGFGAVVAAAICVAGVALRDIDLHFAWQAWHLSYWAGSCGALGLGFAPWSPPPFAWQAWRFARSTFTLRGRLGTYGTGLALTPSLTRHFVTHHLSQTIFHNQLCHTPPLTHHFVTRHLSHTIFVTPRCHTPSFTPLCDTPCFTHHL